MQPQFPRNHCFARWVGHSESVTYSTKLRNAAAKGSGNLHSFSHERNAGFVKENLLGEESPLAAGFVTKQFWRAGSHTLGSMQSVF
jgi:hypothetical protein